MQSYPMALEHADYLFTKNESELVNLSNVKGGTAAEGALPYSPGVFVAAPGEKWSDIGQKYFGVLVGAIGRSPGLVPEIRGVYWGQKADSKIRIQAEILEES